MSQTRLTTRSRVVSLNQLDLSFKSLTLTFPSQNSPTSDFLTIVYYLVSFKGLPGLSSTNLSVYKKDLPIERPIFLIEKRHVKIFVKPK